MLNILCFSLACCFSFPKLFACDETEEKTSKVIVLSVDQQQLFTCSLLVESFDIQKSDMQLEQSKAHRECEDWKKSFEEELLPVIWEKL